MRIKTILEYPEKLPRPLLIFIGFLLALAIGVLDSIINDDISVSLLYLFPIILIAWYEGGVSVAIISIFNVIDRAISDLVSGHIYSHFAIPLWNAIMMLGIFLIVGYSITTLRKLLIREREQALDDDLTGVLNIRFFYEQARVEISRSAKYKQTLTLAYLGIDNLRYINEFYSHTTGDYLLHEVTQTLKATLQPTALISRLGGAEFVILMSGTKTENATAIIHKVQEHLLKLVKKHDWPVTFSTGVVICAGPALTIDALINMAKDLMESAKKNGGHFVKFKILDLSSTPS